MIDRTQFLADVATLVNVESPTADIDACRRGLDAFQDLCQARTGLRPELVVEDGRPHALLQPSGQPSVLILGHVDTVWPIGTLARWPFSVDGDVATGPGVFDMKAGLVMAMHAIAGLPASLRGRVGWLVTTDEETGSATSQALIEWVAPTVTSVLVPEPSAPGGAVKKARKGVASYVADITGRAAHAGLEPEKGVNALMELAEQVPRVASISSPGIGTTVSPTVASAGTTMNTIPANARFRVDVRAETVAELTRVGAALAALQPVHPEASLHVACQGTRPPLEAAMSANLVSRYAAIQARHDIQRPEPVKVGGGSDGNFTAALGTPTLDGVGAVGDGAHAEGEHMTVAATLDNTLVLHELLIDLLG